MSGGKIEHEVVEIRGVSAEGLKHIINFIYTSELRLTQLVSFKGMKINILSG